MIKKTLKKFMCLLSTLVAHKYYPQCVIHHIHHEDTQTSENMWYLHHPDILCLKITCANVLHPREEHSSWMASSKSKTHVLGCPLFQISSHEKRIPCLPQAAGPGTLSNSSFITTSSALTQWLSRAHKSCLYLYNLLTEVTREWKI